MPLDLSPWRPRAPTTPPREAGEEPLRAQLFGSAQLERHARDLAAAQAIGPAGGPRLLPERLRQSARLLRQVYAHLVERARAQRSITLAAEWLLDNFHIVEEHLREVGEDLPPHYYDELPKLASGPLAGYPRVYELAAELVAHTDARIGEGELSRCIEAFQSLVPLSSGELWAIPTMVRIALIDNLRRLATQMLARHRQRDEAEAWAARLLEAGAAPERPRAHDPLEAVGDELVQRAARQEPAFVVHLLQSVRDEHAELAPVVLRLEHQLASQGYTVESLIRLENQIQAANQISVGNTINSLRLVGAIDWTAWFEQVSLVEQLLHSDPAGVYPQMDSASRDRYRHVIERIARRTRQPEEQIAQLALARAVEQQLDPRRGHVGYHLVGPGAAGLQSAAGYVATPLERAAGAVRRHLSAVYLGAIALATLAVLAALASFAWRNSVPGGPLAPEAAVALVLLAGLLPASELAISLVNWIVSLTVPPSTLPKLDFRDGIPAAYPTMIVVPALIESESGIDRLLEDLEVRYLANPDPQLTFALLGDFADAPAEHQPEDERLVAHARAGVQALNARHADGPRRFYFFHRERRWNASENCWMGWERKRGKLAEFNRLLRGADDTSYRVSADELGGLPAIRFVITLDADTRLRRGTAARLVGTLAHPLNRAYYDPVAGRVTQGYGVLQPRVSLDVRSALASWFARIFSGNIGLDPYTTAVSDLYQDLFGEGIYVGKGIYDVDAFAAATDHFPDNALLSHDLIEGLYARAALASDIELVDDFPARYVAWAKRGHRWARGDWQLLPWLGPRVPSQGASQPNPLPAIARWKIADNLRRSLMPPATIVLLALGWLVLPGGPWYWTLLALLVWGFAVYTRLVHGALRTTPRLPYSRHLYAILYDALIHAAQTLLALTFLAHLAQLMVDAIVRTALRLLVTRRRLLEWETSDRVERRLPEGLSGTVARMAGSPLLAAALFVLVVALRPAALPVALPFLAAWAAAPLIAWHLSQQRPGAETPLAPGQRRALRRVARATWRFFEDLVGPETHWLPPDNLQEIPRREVARRTSPTNIGLLALATLAAHDFGYLSAQGLLERLEGLFANIARLERFRGHLYNWYHLDTLAPIPPLYISTVDSGNLAGHLLALKQGLLQLPAQRLPATRARAGLSDEVDLLRRLLVPVDGRQPRAVQQAFMAARAALDQIGLVLALTPRDLGDWTRALLELERQLAALDDALPQLAGVYGEQRAAELRDWHMRLGRNLRAHAAELDALAPWARLLAESPPAESPPAESPPAESPPAESPPAESPPHLGARLAALASPAALAAEGPALERLLESELAGRAPGDPGSTHLRALLEALAAGRAAAVALVERCSALAAQADALAREMDFSFLYDRQRRVFAIGYTVADSALDDAFYDLLASEARLASLLAIAKGDVPTEHWFHLDRPLTAFGFERVLLSWGGTLFEYLMPPLVMRAEPGTLLDESERAAVRRQIRYGTEQDVPWGISESAYNVTDLNGQYQYRAFGVPGLGLKRGLSEDLVVAPYASLLATPIAPQAVLDNLARLRAEGAEGHYGFYEAIDYTRARVPREQSHALVRAYMAHHQGMILVALDNGLNDRPMQARFHAEPLIAAAEMLLQERIPRQAPVSRPRSEELHVVQRRAREPLVQRRYTTPNTYAPRTHLLSNGTYSVMLTNAGGSHSRFRDFDVTRWREDTTRDAWGQFIYVRQRRGGALWSAAYQPTRAEPQEYEAVFTLEKAEYRRRDRGIETYTQVAVSAEDHVEVRLVTLTNYTAEAVELELTSYAEVVLNTAAADRAHPGFSKLFVQTEFVPEPGGLLAWRRPRAADELPLYAVHLAVIDGEPCGDLEYETDRARFLGRGGSVARPAALSGSERLSRTTGGVLDPIFALRTCVRIEPARHARVAFVTACADTREEALALLDKYADRHNVGRVFELAWSHSRVELRHLNLQAEDALVYQRLASRLIYASAALRAPAELIAGNTRGQSALWAAGISGDRPIVVVQIADKDHVRLVHEVVLAHAYWRLKGLTADLVVLNEHPPSYAQELQETLEWLVRTSPAGDRLDQAGGVFLRRADSMAPEDRAVLLSAARAVLSASGGPLSEQISYRQQRELPRPLVPRRPAAPPGPPPAGAPALPVGERVLSNGLGGFTPDGREYVIDLAAGHSTPLPWSNIIAGEAFGCLVTESGLGYTWAVNSRENKLTPWSNDPVADPPGEVLYLRDDETGELWTPTPLPVRRPEPYRIRHGQGYSVFAHSALDIEQELTVFVAPGDPVKVCRLRLRNAGRTPRRLTATYYAEWVLGVDRQTVQLVVTSHAEAHSAVLARNPWSSEFGDRVAFVAVDQPGARVTGDREEFFGRNGTPAAPAALRRVALSDHTGGGLDPCGAVQTPVSLRPGEEKVVIFLLGQAADEAEALALLARYRQPGEAESALAAVRAFWDGLLETVQIATPDPALDVLANRWLLYQALSSRYWARTAFYQAGGAYGFRDQLQDVLAFLYAAPGLTRAHMLRAAAHQFPEGDVLHWWHEPSGRGTRTRSSDDYLWLPYVTATYLQATGDTAVLDEVVPFVSLPVLEPDQEDLYDQPAVAEESATLYEHCRRALDYGLRFGPHGLPLMGTGDWNDGMNRVGHLGRGESVWVAWFLLAGLRAFIAIALERGDADTAARYRSEAERLHATIEAQGWDGEWYRRAYFDDGTPLGSRTNPECQIDAIVQAWKLLSGDPVDERARQALAALDERLVRRDLGLIQLFDPPFDDSPLQPGYIKGYLPGVRENGGQYTHAAIWAAWAFTLLGDGERAGELLALLNPIRHADTPERAAVYRVEPYVIAADIYTALGHVGRGGWTWYTGSASWYYRLALEAVLGLRLEGGRLVIDPCIPPGWPGFQARIRAGQAVYQIEVENPAGVARGVVQVTLDGRPHEGPLALRDDGRTHRVVVTLGPQAADASLEAPRVARRGDEM